MNKNFVKKLETNNFYIGSFDAFIDTETKELLKEKYNMSDEEINTFLKEMPTTYRASITDKNGVYIGFIGIKNVNAKIQSANIVFETKDSLDSENKKEILNEFTKYLKDSINIKYFNNEKSDVISIMPTNTYFNIGIKSEVLEKYNNMYNIPNMSYPVTIVDNKKVLGIMGLTKLIWSNNRADLNMFFDKSLSVDPEFISNIIDDYIAYIHDQNIHNINFSIGANDQKMIEVLENSKMQYYGNIPYSDVDLDTVGNTFLYQHTPTIQRNDKIILPESIYISKPNTIKDEDLTSKIIIDDKNLMVRPSVLPDEIKTRALEGYIKAMENRDNFTIPLGEDKYILQKGNEKYGMTKVFNNFSYIVVDCDGNFQGYINILRDYKEKYHCDIEIGISPVSQNKGLGTKVTNLFYNELFDRGYLSISSQVFEFNNASNSLFNKVAQYNGTRIESYFINGEYWNMNYYTKVNPIVDNNIKNSNIKK